MNRFERGFGDINKAALNIYDLHNGCYHCPIEDACDLVNPIVDVDDSLWSEGDPQCIALHKRWLEMEVAESGIDKLSLADVIAGEMEKPAQPIEVKP